MSANLETPDAVIAEMDAPKDGENAAKLRELVRRIVKSLGGKAETAPANMTPHEVAILNQCRAALAAPPRNCDRFATIDEARKAHEEYRTDYIMRASNKFDFPMEFGAWLFAPATAKEGSAK